MIDRFFDTLSDLLALVSSEGRLLRANRALCHLVGCEPERLSSLADLIHPEDWPTLAQALETSIQGGSAHARARLRGIHGDQALHWQLHPDMTDGTVWMVGHEPAAERLELALAALRESEDRYHALTDASVEALALHENGLFLEINPAFTRMFGFEPEEIVGRPGLELMTAPEALPDMRERIESHFEGTYQTVLRRKDGSTFPGEIRVRTTFYRGREVRVASLRDLTESRRSEQNLRLFQFFSEHANDAHVLLDHDARILYANRLYTEQLGYSNEELLTLSIPDIDMHYTTDKVQALFEACRRGRVAPFEAVHRRKDGTTFPVEITVTALEVEGRPLMFASVRDITARKRDEQELADSRLRLAGIVESAMDAIISIDEQQRIIVFNPAAEKMFRCPANEALYSPLDRFIPVRHRAAHHQHVQRFGQTGETARAMGHLRPLAALRADGEEFPIEASISQTEAGGKKLFTVILRDITERQRSEDALHQATVEAQKRAAEAEEAERTLAALMQHIPQGIVITGGPPEFRLEHVSQFALTLSGRSRDQMLGMPSGQHQEAWGLSLHDGSRPVAGDTPLWRATHLGEETRNAELMLVRPDGSRIPILVNAAPIRDAAGEVIGGIQSSQDISMIKQTEAELRRSRDELEHRVQQRTHELRRRAEQLARLASELTLTEQRERRRLAQVLHDHLQQLLVGAKFGLEALARRVPSPHETVVSQIQELLDESINVSRSLTVELSPPILHEAGLAAGLEWLARWFKEKQGLEVELELETAASPDADDIKILLFQAVRELLLNVVKHSGSAEARVTLKAHDHDWLVLIVSDRGRGFDPQSLAGAELLKSGFGLMSIRERLGLLGGRLEIASQPHEGTRLTLLAPLRPRPTEQPTATIQIIDEEASPTPVSPNDRLRILLVDDHQVVREGLTAILSDEPDLEIVGEAVDGLDAVQKARQLAPDVILMDFTMPRMDGVEATRVIRREQPRIRLIGLSMYEEPDRAQAMIAAGADAYASKSGEIDTLLKLIRAI